MMYFCILSAMSFLTVHYYTQISGKPVISPNPGIISLGHIFFFAIGSILASSWGNEKTYRNHIRLPLAAWKVGLLRLGTFVLYWFFLITGYILWSGISQYFAVDRVALIVMSSQTGLILMAASLIFFWRDLRKTSDSVICFPGFPMRKLFGGFIILLLLLIGFTSMAGTIYTYQGNLGGFIDCILAWLYHSDAGSFILVLLGVFSAAGTILTFSHRRSYID